MGLAFSSLYTRLFGLPETKLLILGLDNAGKTTTMYRMTLGEVVATAPTVGSNSQASLGCCTLPILAPSYAQTD